jgi:hypothetical protein
MTAELVVPSQVENGGALKDPMLRQPGGAEAVLVLPRCPHVAIAMTLGACSAVILMDEGGMAASLAIRRPLVWTL